MVAALFAQFLALAWLRLRVISPGGYDVNVQKRILAIANPYAVLADPGERFWSIAHVHALIAELLFWPNTLSHEHNALPPVTSLSDLRIAKVLALWLVLVLAVHWMLWAAWTAWTAGTAAGTMARAGAGTVAGTVVRTVAGPSGADRDISEQTPALTALRISHGQDGHGEDDDMQPTAYTRLHVVVYATAVILIGVLPASHLLIQVGFVLAERTLFLPSFGAALLMAELADTVAAAAASLLLVCVPLSTRTNADPDSGHDRNDDGNDDVSGTKDTAGGDDNDNDDDDTNDVDISTRRPQHHHRRRAFLHTLLLLAVGLPVAAVFAVRAHTRSLDWRSEEQLLLSNLAVYPRNNYMSNYGLGAIALYRGDSEGARHYLMAASKVAPSIEEPKILLAQLAWHRRLPDEQGWAAEAISHLSGLRESRRFRSHVLTNLGARADAAARGGGGENKEQESVEIATSSPSTTSSTFTRSQAEYLIIAAADESTMMMTSDKRATNIGLIFANAACARLTSDVNDWGHRGEVASLLRRGLERAWESSGDRAVRGLEAVQYTQGIVQAVKGAFHDSLHSLDAAAALAKQQGGEGEARRRKYETLRGGIAAKEGLLRAWADNTTSWVGAVAQRRLGVIGAECELNLVWM